MRPTVLLFDLDGTLVLTGGAGRRSMEAAFARAAGAAAPIFEGFQFGGMTDLGIVRAGLATLGRDLDEAIAAAILEVYLGVLEEEVRASPRYEVLPGVREVLAGVSGRADVAVGLGTGNIERGARIKLERGELSELFSFGGFGSDSEDRAELLEAGARRGAERLGAERQSCRVVVIGDTPRDVHAARAISAECVGVGTGGHTPEELRAAGAAVAVPDLASEGVLEALLRVS